MHSESGVVVWLTGLSGAGKSTLAARTAAAIRALGRRVEVLDGDVVRQQLSSELGFSRAERDLNVMRVAFVASLLARNGVVVLVAMISPYRDTRERARGVCGRFLEVFVCTPLSVCATRDPKGLYARAMRGEVNHFTGVSDPYEEPLTPDVRIDGGALSVEAATAELVAGIGRALDLRA
jgi:adenylylsulfate kinase